MAWYTFKVKPCYNHVRLLSRRSPTSLVGTPLTSVMQAVHEAVEDLGNVFVFVAVSFLFILNIHNQSLG